MFLFFSTNTTTLEQLELDNTIACPKCGSKKVYVDIAETKLSALFTITTVVKAGVECGNCGKKISKNNRDNSIQQIVAQKEIEYKPRFFKRFGGILILTFLGLMCIIIPVVSAVMDSKKTVQNAQSNYAQCYDPTLKQEWLDNLSPGDYILAAKNNSNLAQVYRISEFKGDTTVLIAFDQFIPREEYTSLDQLNALKLGQGDSEEYLVKTKRLRTATVEHVSVDMDLRDNGYIWQIKKK